MRDKSGKLKQEKYMEKTKILDNSGFNRDRKVIIVPKYSYDIGSSAGKDGHRPASHFF